MSTRHPASLARRLLPAVAMTTAASGLVALLDQGSSGAAGNVGGAAAGLPNQGAVAVTTGPPVVSSTLPAVAAPPSPPVAVSPSQPARQPVATVPPAPVGTTRPAASGSCQGKTIDGPTVNTRWGPVQVEAVVSTNGQICNVDAIQSPDSHGRSVQINNYALPILHKEVMKAQSLNINGVSGATITSYAYAQSLQSILDGLGR